MNPPTEVAATANWYFMIASTIMLGIVGAFVVRRFTIPGAASFMGMDQVAEVSKKSAELTPEERKGLKHARIAFGIFALIVVLLTAPPWGPLRNPETGSLVVESPFLRGLIPILFVMFAVPGYFYGRAVGTITKFDDLIKHMEHGMRNLAGYIVLMLVVAQFIYMFTYSNLDTILAVKGAEFLQRTGLTGPLLFILFILLIATLNIFMGSGSAKWAIFAPVFIPMLAQLNYSPAFVQLMYRVGDSVTNSISPLYPYFPLLLGWIRQYDKRVGIGTTISMLLPYAMIVLLMWVVLLFIWFGFKLPVGVGEFIYMK
jgi:aminobenzoyl-glutamate transport protein